jgi:hypothetical protein
VITLTASQSQPVLQQVQINFIFNDNVCILCLSCNIKKSKTPAKLSLYFPTM